MNLPLSTPPPHSHEESRHTQFFDAVKVITDEYESKRLINALTYGSYHANRGYGMSSEAYAKMMGWNEETRLKYESAYQMNLEQQINNDRFRKFLKDVEEAKDI